MDCAEDPQKKNSTLLTGECDRVRLDGITLIPYFITMKALVTSKGQVTIPKELRDRFGIEPGVQVDFVPVEGGIRLRKVVDRSKQAKVFGCLKAELGGRSVTELLNEVRGPVVLPKAHAKGERQ